MTLDEIKESIKSLANRHHAINEIDFDAFEDSELT